MSQESSIDTLSPGDKPAQPKRSLLKIIGISCLSITVCMFFAGAIFVFSGGLSGPHGNRNDYPSWSPNGNNDIYLMDADGLHITQLTKDLFASVYILQSAADVEPVWSPDGSHIAFTSGRDNTMMNYIDTNIYVMDADSSNIKQLTGVGHEDAGPDWAPNGKQIAYVSKDTFTSDDNLMENPTWNIYLINVDGSNEIQLTNDPANELEMAWSPDGTQLAFISDRNGHDFDIYVMNVDGSDVVKVTNDAGNEFGPAWSPDGSQIAFNSDHNGNVQLFVMNADGSDITQLTSDKSNSAYPAWSPDGSHIVFESDREDGNANIYIMNTDGSNIVRLTEK